MCYSRPLYSRVYVTVRDVLFSTSLSRVFVTVRDVLFSTSLLQGICDGAGCVILASEAAVSKYNLTPLARLAGYGISGCDPSIMGIGPVPAIKALLGKANLQLDDIPRIEVRQWTKT